MPKTRRGPMSAAQEYDAYVSTIVRDFGVFIQSVAGHPATRSASFAYTVGLTTVDHAELLFFGHGASCSGGILNDVASKILAGTRLSPGDVIDVDSGTRATVEVVPNPDQIALTAVRYFRRRHRRIELLQLTVPDLEGRFPWDAGYAIDPWIQPRPGEFRA